MQIDLTAILNHEGKTEEYSVPMELDIIRTGRESFPVLEKEPV